MYVCLSSKYLMYVRMCDLYSVSAVILLGQQFDQLAVSETASNKHQAVAAEIGNCLGNTRYPQEVDRQAAHLVRMLHIYTQSQCYQHASGITYTYIHTYMDNDMIYCMYSMYV